MKMRVLIVFLIVCCVACKADSEENAVAEKKKPDTEIVFDKVKWKTMDGMDYPYRDNMLNDVIYNDTVRSLNRNEILNLLGEPNRINENHLYYMIAKKRLGFLTLHTKTMVIKLSEDDKIDWIKIHE